MDRSGLESLLESYRSGTFNKATFESLRKIGICHKELQLANYEHKGSWKDIQSQLSSLEPKGSWKDIQEYESLWELQHDLCGWTEPIVHQIITDGEFDEICWEIIDEIELVYVGKTIKGNHGSWTFCNGETGTKIPIESVLLATRSWLTDEFEFPNITRNFNERQKGNLTEYIERTISRIPVASLHRAFGDMALDGKSDLGGVSTSQVAVRFRKYADSALERTWDAAFINGGGFNGRSKNYIGNVALDETVWIGVCEYSLDMDSADDRQDEDEGFALEYVGNEHVTCRYCRGLGKKENVFVGVSIDIEDRYGKDLCGDCDEEFIEELENKWRIWRRNGSLGPPP